MNKSGFYPSKTKCVSSDRSSLVMWETHDSWKETMQHCWGGVAPALRLVDLHDKLKKVASNLGKWNRDTFGSVRKEIKKLTAELERLRSEPGRTGPSHLEIKLNDKLVELYHREELMWRQRSRIEWLASGEKNTRFFHFNCCLKLFVARVQRKIKAT